jgi:hypothetical protein
VLFIHPDLGIGEAISCPHVSWAWIPPFLACLWLSFRRRWSRTTRR